MKLRQFNTTDQIIILVIGTTLMLEFPATLLRLANVGPFTGLYFDLVFVAIVGLSFFNAIVGSRVALKELPFAFMILFFLVWIGTLGVFLSNDNPLGGLRYFFLPLAMYLLLIGRKFPLFFYTSANFWKLVVVANIFGLIFYFTTLIGTVYAGIGGPAIAYAAIYFFANSNPVLFIISMIIVFLEGKRGVLLSLLIALIFLRMIRLNATGRLLYSVAGSLLLVGAIVVFLISIVDVEGSVTINRINFLNPFSEKYDLLLGSSGRLGEILSIFRSNSPGELFMGLGSGFKYEWDLGYASPSAGETKGYLHMSVMNYLVVGGPLGLFVFLYLLLMPFKASRLKEWPKAQTTAFGLGMYSVFQSFFGFSFAVHAPSLIFILAPALVVLPTIRYLHRPAPLRADLATP